MRNSLLILFFIGQSLLLFSQTNFTPKTFLGLGEMTLMWILMAIAHSANACYCDIKSLLKKKKL